MADPTDTVEREDERAQRPGICGVTRTTGGIEWICIREVHAEVYRRRTRVGEVFESNPGVDRHYYVNRYPWRERVSADA